MERYGPGVTFRGYHAHVDTAVCGHSDAWARVEEVYWSNVGSGEHAYTKI